MSNIVVQEVPIKRVLTSRLTWFLVILWAVFISAFIIFEVDHLPLFSHWLARAILYTFSFLFGFAGIFFFKYNTRIYMGKIKSQNQLLSQRESMLRKSNEKLLKQSKFLKLVTDSFSHPFIVIDANSYEILIANKAFIEQNSLPENFQPHRNKCYELSHQFTHPCSGTSHPCPLQQAKQSGKPVVMQHRHNDGQGRERMMEITAFPVFDEESGKVKQIIEYNVDITDRLNEQIELAKKEAELRTIITTSPDGISVIDLDGNITFASEKSAALLGFSDPQELLGKNIYDFVHPDDLARARKTAEDLILKRLPFENNEFQTIKIDGTIFYQETNASLLFDKNDKVYALVLVSRDVTERKYTQERLLNLNEQLKEQRYALEELNTSLEKKIREEVDANREKDRMLALQSRQAAMGEMIGNIAHQWRQPLNTINLIIFDLLEASKHGELNEQYMQLSYAEVNKVVQNMSQTIDDFRNFFKPIKEVKVFDINKVVEQALSFTAAVINANKIQAHFNPTVDIEVLGYPNELIQTLINILENAIDALLVSDVQPMEIRIKTTRQKGKAIIEICNNGMPIEHENLDKIFDPYFSTKPESQGTGLGLFIGKTIVEKNMNGKLTVQNLDSGPCFQIELPCCNQ